jgi:tetratricopeptide (TPR) repeat protein
MVLLGIAAAVTHASPTPASALVHSPATDDEPLETLPAQSEIRRNPRSTNSAENAATAVERARTELTQYQKSSDPRYLGRAEAALGRFWDEPNPPEPVLVLRARIRQSNHEFSAALADLDRAARLTPDDAQALLDRASIETVIGRYEAARGDCQRVEALAAPLYGSMCRAAIAGVTGSARAAITDLSRLLSSAQIEVEERCWAKSLLGELSTRVGDLSTAEAHFVGVLDACPSDSYVKGALADLWLDQHRDAQIVRLLAEHVRQDALLLRLTIAERRLEAPTFATHFADLRQRFDEARLRGSSVHRREEARFELALRDDAARALSLALVNFEVQREPADVRIALEAALAAGKPEGARRVATFARNSGLEDPQISSLLTRFPR